MRYWLRKDPPRRAGFRDAAEVVRFDGDGEPVRIFLGTEPMQARAERVFLWSVAKNRNPSRAYEVHLMRDLAGFDRTRWTTGFTNYRFAIPELAGRAGRAIYNDVDQIYLADPAEMFDLPMDGAGVLCIDEGETSVALIDCAAMSSHWRIEDARTKRQRRHFLEPLVSHSLWGSLERGWNARDDEYRPGSSKCLHFTTLRFQPWRPFPDQLRYAEHPDAGVWRALEDEANTARFSAFSRARPSSRFAAALDALAERPPRFDEAAFARLAAPHRLDRDAFVDGGPEPAFPRAAATGSRRAIVSAALGRLPEDDVPWALDELFAAAERFVLVAVPEDAGDEPWMAATYPAAWWKLQLELAAARTPGRLWRLAKFRLGQSRPVIHDGSPDLIVSRAA